MNRADIWLGSDAPNSQPGNVEVRGFDTARLINARPSTIVVSRRDPETRQTIQLPPQVVRIEAMQNIRGAKDLRDSMVSISEQYVVVIGIFNHPTLPDTNVLRADRFLYNGGMYEVIEFISTVPGRMLISCELRP